MKIATIELMSLWSRRMHCIRLFKNFMDYIFKKELGKKKNTMIMNCII
jgi:hypothetical protein